jgi:hypothetical protein
MPVILQEEHHEAWLSGEAGKEVLAAYPADRMKAWPVSPRVNSPKNNDPVFEANSRISLVKFGHIDSGSVYAKGIARHPRKYGATGSYLYYPY